MLFGGRPGSHCCKSLMSCLLQVELAPLLYLALMSVHMLECMMQAKSRSNLQPCCFASLWQINPSCGFVRLCVHAAPTAPVNHRCRFWMSFTGRWGPIWFDRWGEAYGPYHWITHTEGRESCYSCNTSDPLECTHIHSHTHTGSMHKDRQRPRQAQRHRFIYACMQELQRCPGVFKLTLSILIIKAAKKRKKHQTQPKRVL